MYRTRVEIILFLLRPDLIDDTIDELDEEYSEYTEEDEIRCQVCTLGVKIRSLKVDFKTGGTWRRVRQYL